MTRLAFVILAVLALAGCDEDNTLYCQGHPDDVAWCGPGGTYCTQHPDDPYCGPDGYCQGTGDNGAWCNPDAGVDGSTLCTDDEQCTQPALGVCDTASGTCVECTADNATACTATTPVCGSDDRCRGCASDSECASDACDTGTGACFAEADVIYLAPGGAAGSCTQAAPCATFAQGLAQDARTRTIIKAATGNYSEPTVTVSGLTVTILGVGAILEPASTNQHGLFATSGANVTLIGVTIRSAGGTGVGVRCDPGAGSNPTLHMQGATVSGNAGGGVTASNCTVTVESSTVSGNAGGGVSLSGGTFSLINDWIVGNGSPTTSTYGGVSVSNIVGAGTRAMDFNTIYDNTSAGSDPGVTCLAVVVPLSFGNNIIYGNETGSQAGGTNCAFTYSNIGPTATAGSGNVNMAPLFVDVINGDYHLVPTSPGIDAADPAATLAVDIDGDARPQGVGRDMGADEVVP